jgi:hypothetical protein
MIANAETEFRKAALLCRACEEMCFAEDPVEQMEFYEEHLEHVVQDMLNCANNKGQPWTCEGEQCATCGCCEFHCTCGG